MHPEETRPLLSALEAAVSLLADADARVVSRCREHVLAWGAEALPVLRRAAAAPDARLRLRARALIKTLMLRGWLEEVRGFARAFGREHQRRRNDCLALETGLLLLSSIGASEPADRGTFTKAITDCAETLRSRVRGRTAASAARALGALVGGELGLTADGANFFDLDALRPDRVWAARVGLPITLCELYLLVGRRAGLRVTAVSLPRDWLNRVHGARPVLLDPVRGGDSLTKADCVRHLRATGYSRAASTYLVDLDDRALLTAHVRSLQQVFGYREDSESLRALRQAADLLAPPSGGGAGAA